jgi:hypothetical protein
LLLQGQRKVFVLLRILKMRTHFFPRKTVTDTMLALRAEVYPGQEMRDISIGEFSLRLADELANN